MFRNLLFDRFGCNMRNIYTHIMTYTKHLPLSFVALFFSFKDTEIKLFMVHFHRHKYIVLIPPADNINISCHALQHLTEKKKVFIFIQCKYYENFKHLYTSIDTYLEVSRDRWYFTILFFIYTQPQYDI